MPAVLNGDTLGLTHEGFVGYPANLVLEGNNLFCSLFILIAHRLNYLINRITDLVR